jgi:hypothetical protein
MYLPASLAMLFTLLLLTLSASAQLTQAFASSLPSPAAFPAVHGTVLSPDGRPASGIHVELDDAATAVPVTSTLPSGTAPSNSTTFLKATTRWWPSPPTRAPTTAYKFSPASHN